MQGRQDYKERYTNLKNMPSIEELKAQIHQVRQQLFQQLPDIALRNTIIAKGMAEKNIREIGFGAKYSGNKLPAWFFDGKQKSDAGKAYIKRVEKRDEKNATTKNGVITYAEDSGMTWAELRQAEGLPIDHVDLGFTNKMWAGLGPQEPYFRGTMIICPLGGSTREVVDKLNWNRQRYGDFLGRVLGETELEMLTLVARNRLKKVFTDNGFNF